MTLSNPVLGNTTLVDDMVPAQPHTLVETLAMMIASINTRYQ